VESGRVRRPTIAGGARKADALPGKCHLALVHGSGHHPHDVVTVLQPEAYTRPHCQLNVGSFVGYAGWRQSVNDQNERERRFRVYEEAPGF